jgi:LmbE family N-acetylglucosaminyl deacetylase
MVKGGFRSNPKELFGDRVLVVAAHPDDEVLGAGGTIARIKDSGIEVHVLFLADGVTSRMPDSVFEVQRDGISKRRLEAKTALGILNCDSFEFLDFPDNGLDAVPILEIARKLESTIMAFNPELILTHSSADLNVDHTVCLQASLVAGRPGKSTVRGIFSFEVASSTGLGFASSPPFSPNLYFDISAFLPSKVRAASAYTSEIPVSNHPRSREALERLAKYRGDQICVAAAEAFQIQRLYC